MDPSHSRRVADIKHPHGRMRDDAIQQSGRFHRDQISKYIGIGLLLLLLVIASVYVALNIRESTLNIYRGFKGVIDDIRSFGGSDLENSLNSIEQDLDELDERARFLSLAPKLREIPGAINDLREIISVVANLGNTFETLRSDGLAFAFSGRGEELLTALRLMRFDLGRLGDLSDGLLVRAKEFGAYEEDVESMNSQLAGLEEGLNVVINFLDTEGEKRIVLLFENHSELRPSGGFAGSYGELVLERGNIKSLEVNDIYYPDKFLVKKVIPPLQLQGITPNWGARDTNWFFDFADSSEKLLEYLEASTLYGDQDITFDGVIAMNVRVIEDILRLTGPLDLSDYGLSLNVDNFLREIQAEVEVDKNPGENPKLILKSAAPLLLEAIGKLDNSSQSSLLDVFLSRAKNKDVKFYFRNKPLEFLVSDWSVGGRDYELGADFVGDYLAVVNANVAGGKTDVFVDQTVELASQIGADGTVYNDLTVSRTHRGGNEPEYFYNKINQNFLRIFTVPDAQLESIQGGIRKEIQPLVNYVGSVYAEDENLSELEDSRTLLNTPTDGYAEKYTHSGKCIFGTWLNIPPGESRVLVMRYSGDSIPLIDGQQYKFVIDKQSGSEMVFGYTITAPAGFEWLESGGQVFRHQTSDLPARLEIDLTLKKSHAN
ncbi:MAG: DUF4012 domain-containing protein [Candidatus Colwellbacteria bacterium]|nr:DUF4012 domain-containing protein [Candidatus Colwellbacteria bacterium]